MSIDIAGHTTGEWFADVTGDNPSAMREAALGFTAWTENESPFAESPVGAGLVDAGETAYEQVLNELRDESFDEALEALVAETAEVVHERFADELGAPDHRAGLASAHLSPVEMEAEAYVDRLAEGLAGTDLVSFSEVQLQQLVDSFDPGAVGSSSPAGEEFIGGLVRKAKKIVGSVVSTVKKVGGAVGKVLGGVLGHLRKLIRPLLKRVLSFAIGRLPVPLRPAARILAGKLGFEAESAAGLEEELEQEVEASAASPTVRTDPLALAESFDAALAETIVGGEAAAEAETESFDPAGGGELEEGHELEQLAAARAELVSRFAAAGDGEDLAPAIEQFVPALLGALRIGLRLVGRPKVVGFLAKALAGMISKWVGPQMAPPLSSAIVDIGLRLLTLEASEDEQGESEAAPTMLAATIEDAVRRFAEHEEFVFEDEGLMQLALAESFEGAVGAAFPAQFVRPDLQLAPSLGGSFVARRMRTTAPYRKYSRVPQVELTLQQAEGLMIRGGTTLAAAMRAQGLPLPGTYRVHVFEAMPGTTLRQVAQRERALARATGRPWSHIHPLSRRAAAVLLREPRLGARVAPAFRRSHQRIAVGQRFFYLEPVGVAPALSGTRAMARPSATSPTQGWITVDLVRSRAIVAIYLSEGEAQAVAAAVRDGRGSAVLLRTAVTAYRAVETGLADGSGRLRVVRDASMPLPRGASATGRLSPAFRARVLRDLRRAALPAISRWAAERGPELARAANDPAAGVTLVVTLPGAAAVDDVRRALSGVAGPSPRTTGTAVIASAAEVTVRPGMVRS